MKVNYVNASLEKKNILLAPWRDDGNAVLSVGISGNILQGSNSIVALSPLSFFRFLHYLVGKGGGGKVVI